MREQFSTAPGMQMPNVSGSMLSSQMQEQLQAILIPDQMQKQRQQMQQYASGGMAADHQSQFSITQGFQALGQIQGQIQGQLQGLLQGQLQQQQIIQGQSFNMLLPPPPPPPTLIATRGASLGPENKGYQMLVATGWSNENVGGQFSVVKNTENDSASIIDAINAYNRTTRR